MPPKSPCFLVTRPCALRPDSGVGRWAHSRPALIFASLFLAQTHPPVAFARASPSFACLLVSFAQAVPHPGIPSRSHVGFRAPRPNSSSNETTCPFWEIARFCVEPRSVAGCQPPTPREYQSVVSQSGPQRTTAEAKSFLELCDGTRVAVGRGGVRVRVPGLGDRDRRVRRGDSRWRSRYIVVVQRDAGLDLSARVRRRIHASRAVSVRRDIVAR